MKNLETTILYGLGLGGQGDLVSIPPDPLSSIGNQNENHNDKNSSNIINDSSNCFGRTFKIHGCRRAASSMIYVKTISFELAGWVPLFR